MQSLRSHLPLIAFAGLLGALAFALPGRLSEPAPSKPTPSAPEPSKPAPAVKRQLLLFTQRTCPPCRVLEASLQDAAVKAYLDAHFVLTVVCWPDPRFAENGVMGTPALIAVLPNATKKRMGPAAPQALLAWLQSLASAQTRRPARPGNSSGKIVEAGYDGPDGRHVQIDFPSEWWKANITSRGQGCCVFRIWDFISHYQNVPALWNFPEWLKQNGLPGGGYPENVTERITRICQDRKASEPDYLNIQSKNYELLKLILATGRMAGVDYSGADGVHYPDPIAHCVALVYVDDNYVAILDNNFPPDKLLWMPASEFKKRWGGWTITLCAPRPPAAPHN